MATVTMTVPTTSQQPRKKRAYTRPCDRCAVRRIRCDMETQPNHTCTHCQVLAVECTNNRVRHKSGPKKIHSKTKEAIRELIQEQATSTTQPQIPRFMGSSTPATCEQIAIHLSELRPLLEVYRTRYYGIWPVIDTKECLDLLERGSVVVRSTQFLVLDKALAPTYALACSLCAAVARHIMFWTEKQVNSVAHFGVRRCHPPEKYAQEAERTIYEYHIDEAPSIDLVLSNFFLHIYLGSLTQTNSKELVYLRQAISCAQLLCLFDTLDERPRAEAHRIKKIYYLMLITERYVCFKAYLPVILEPTLPLPNLEDDDHPEALRGFVELAQVFSAADTEFFNELSARGKGSAPSFDIFNSSLEMLLKRDWIKQVQDKLSGAMVQVRNHSQKFNILVSRTWLQSIGWSLANDKLLLSANGVMDCFDIKYPLQIATDFLLESRDIPTVAYESNGPGAMMKLIELADALHSFIQISPMDSIADTALAFDQLSTVHGVILRHKVDFELPQRFHQITDALQARQFGFRHIDVSGYASSSGDSGRIEELFEDDEDDSRRLDSNDLELQSPSPYVLQDFEFPLIH